MIKVIYGKVGEGKTRECIREIENAIDCTDIGILSRDGDFLSSLRYFGNIEILNSKNITLYTLNTSIDNIINRGNKFDMLIIDGYNESFNEITNKIPDDRFKKVIITQQLHREYEKEGRTKITFSL